MTSKNWSDYQMPKHIPQGIPAYFSVTMSLLPHFSVNQLVWHMSLFALSEQLRLQKYKFAIWLNNVIYVKKKHILSHSPVLKCARCHHVYHVYRLPHVSKTGSIYVNRHIEVSNVLKVFSPLITIKKSMNFFMSCRNSGIHFLKNYHLNPCKTLCSIHLKSIESHSSITDNLDPDTHFFLMMFNKVISSETQIITLKIHSMKQ